MAKSAAGIGLLEEDEAERQPGQRRDRPHDLHQRIEHARDQRRDAEQEAERRADAMPSRKPGATRIRL
jgi:hypothetical protein